MTVEELLKALENAPKSAEVYVRDADGDWGGLESALLDLEDREVKLSAEL